MLGIFYPMPKLLHILQHSLGVDQYGQGSRYRNYFATSKSGEQINQCSELVSLGLMRRQGSPLFATELVYFSVTKEGVDHVAIHSPSPPKLTRSQIRYRRYLQADSGMKFGEWLHHAVSNKEGGIA